MERQSAFSYVCNRCGCCCRNQVITLSPFDVIALARAAGISTGEAVRRYTIRRGSLLKFDSDGSCTALTGATCRLYRGRPLPCRLYPLGLERGGDNSERFIVLEPATGSLGRFGERGTVQSFLDHQDTEACFAANRRYAELLALLRERIVELTDFTQLEPREFWRVALREALAETSFDANLLIDAMFDPDRLECRVESEIVTVERHIAALEACIGSESDPAQLAAAAIMLAVSLGYAPAEFIRSVPTE